MISIRPLVVVAAVDMACLAVTAAVSGTLADSGGKTTGSEAAVIVVLGLASIAGIAGALAWANRAWDREIGKRS